MRYSSKREVALWTLAIIQVVLIIVAVGLSIAAAGCVKDARTIEIVPTTLPADMPAPLISQDTSGIKAHLWSPVTAVAKMFTRDVTVSGGTYIGPTGGWIAAGLLAMIAYHRTARWHGKRKLNRKLSQRCEICGHKQ